MEILKTNIEKLNPKFKVELVAKPWSDLLKESRSGGVPMIIIGWAPDYADPDNFLYTFYHSEGYYHPRSNFSDPVMDSLLDQARKTTDPAKRKALYSQVGYRAYELAPYINVPAGLGFIVYNEKLRGVEENYNPMFSNYFCTFFKNLSK